MAKKKSNPRKPNKRWERYDTSGGLKRKNKFCPKCGEGVFLAKHKDRETCGKCGYTQFAGKESPAKETEKAPEAKPAPEVKK